MNWDAIADALASAPRLPGALCVGRWQQFDDARPDEAPEAAQARHAAAVDVCRTCPALEPCRRWIDGLPAHKRPPGVVAAQVIVEPPAARRGRPPREATAA